MRDKRGGVYLAFLDELKYLFAVTAVHTSSLEGEVLAVHLRQWQHLWLVVEGYDRYDGIWTSTLPSQLECVFSTCHLQHPVSSSMVAVLHDNVRAFLWCCQQDIRIVLLDEGASFF